MKKGDLAPDFKVLDHNGREIVLSDVLQKGPAVLFFYPADGSPVCTREACLFRDALSEFDQFNARIIGISPDSNEKHRDFASGHSFPYSLISDADGSLRKSFEVKKRMLMIPGRETFVIGTDRRVISVADSQLDAASHVQVSLAALREAAQA